MRKREPDMDERKALRLRSTGLPWSSVEFYVGRKGPAFQARVLRVARKLATEPDDRDYSEAKHVVRRLEWRRHA